MSVTKAKTDNITSLNAAQLTGVLPAMSGAALTGLTQPTKSANDPTISTNPSGGVGTLWANTTSGEMFACTDATAGANVWINVGAGDGDVEPWSFNDGGSSYGYYGGGHTLVGAAPTNINVIDRFSFTADGNATDVADLTKGRSSMAGASSQTHGYSAGGYGGTNGTGAGTWNVVDRISFASVGNATDVGDINYSGGSNIGPISGTTNGDKAYFTNNMSVANGGSHGITTAVFSKYTMSSNITASVSLDLGSCHPTPIAYHSNGLATSDTHCYSTGGYTTNYHDLISKMPYASEGNATDVGDLDVGSAGGVHDCTQSKTHGYKFGGGIAGPPSAYDDGRVEKWSFASDGNSSVIGALLVAVAHANTNSSTTHGYTSGGGYYNKTYKITKMNYATEATLVDVGDLTTAGTGGKRNSSSMQV